MYTLNESLFIGKTPYLIECEKLLTAMKADKQYPNTRYVYLAKIERLLEKQFGIYECHFMMMHSAIPNAFTIPMTASFQALDPSKHKVIQGKYGPSFDPAAKVRVVMVLFSALWDEYNLTSAQVLGIMLHEIGHNFERTPLTRAELMVDNITLVTDVYKGIHSAILRANPLELIHSLSPTSVSKLVTTAVHSDIGSKLLTKTSDNMKNPVTAAINSTYSYVTSSMQMFQMVWNKLKFLFKIFKGTAIGPTVKFNPLVALDGIIGFKKELYSDTFASLYGYGADTAMALNQLEKRGLVFKGYSLNDYAVIGLPLNLVSLVYSNISLFMDPHPDQLTRIRSQIAVLERDLKLYEYSGETKKSLEKEIAGLRAALAYATPTFDKVFKDQNYISTLPMVLYRKFCMFAFDGYSDWRSTFMRLRSHDTENLNFDYGAHKKMPMPKTDEELISECMYMYDIEPLDESAGTEINSDWVNSIIES
jgi:hypothetical protein